MARNRVFKTEHYELRACGCRSWFCPNCCRTLGMGLRKRVVKAVEKWQSVMMFTLTFDPELFEGPEECYRYARKKRVVAILIRRLAEKGFLHSKQYFAVWEYHKSGWPHIHLLVDASFVPFETVCEIWNRNRPKEAGAVKEGRPGFGGVRFSAPKFSSKAHAANYATKYLIKAPEEGWPEWVMWFEGQIHRYSTSRGFFQDGPKFKGGEEIETAMVPHGLSCFCEVCREACDAHGTVTTTPPEPYQPDAPSDADDTYGVGDPPGGWQKIEVFTMRYHPGDTTYTPIPVGTIMEWNGANYVVVPDEVFPRGDSVEGHGSWLTIRWGDSYYMVVSVSASGTVSVPECDYGAYTSECSAEGFALFGEGDDPGSGDDDDDDCPTCECPGCCDYITGQLASDIGQEFRAALDSALADLPQRIWAEFQSTVQNPLINQMGDEIYETFNNMTADGEILDEWLERRLEEAVNEMGDEIYETFNNMTSEGEILDEWLADNLTKLRTDSMYDLKQYIGERMPDDDGLDQGPLLYKERDWDLKKPSSYSFSRQWGLQAPNPENHSFSLDIPLPGGTNKYVVVDTSLSGTDASNTIAEYRRIARACLLVMVSVVMVGNILRTLRQY